MPAIEPHSRFLLDCLRGTASCIPGSGDFDWEKFISSASHESLLQSIYGLLVKAELLAQAPEEVVDFLFAVRELNRERNREIFEQIRVIAFRLNRIGIEPLLLKGSAYLLSGVYHDGAERFLADVDFLVAKNDIPAALQVLTELGYTFKLFDPIDHATYHSYAVLTRADSINIDLHQTVGLGRSNEVLPANDMLLRSSAIDLEGTRVRLPAPGDLMIHHILHSQVHEQYRDRIWTPLRSLYDLTLLQRRFGTSIDWNSISHRFKNRHVYGALVLYFTLAEETLGFESPSKLRMGPVLRFRWWHRKLLRRRPSARFFDPFWFYAAGVVPRTRRLRDILRQPGGLRYLLRKLFSLEFFSRLKADLS